MKNTLLLSAVAVSIVGAGFFAMNSSTSVSPSYEERTQLTSNSKAQSWSNAQQFQKMFRADVNTGEIDIRKVLQAREHVAFKSHQRAGVGLAWKERGPDNVGGRTRALMVDKLDTTGNTVYAGSIAGGLFKSNNGGATWAPINDQSLAPAISCIDQGTNGTIYVGTGCTFERFSGTGSSGLIGGGMYKSTDGNTFTLLSSTIPAANNSSEPWAEINAVAVDPANDKRVFAATKGGLMLTTDGGATWSCAYTNVLGNCVGNAYDVKIADDGTVIAVLGSNVIISANGNIDSFNNVSGTDVPGWNRTIVKFAPSNNDTVWALSETGGELKGLYRSVDRGYNWLLVQGNSDGAGFGTCCGLFNGQANYDLALGVNPRDASIAYVGGVQLWRYDGGLTRIASEFTPVAMFNVHSDKHDIVFDPHNPKKMFIGSDGGITVSYDEGQTYWPANKGYNTFTCYAVAYDNDGKVMGGAQDNGTYEVTGDIFTPGVSTGLEGESVSGGDGYDCDYSQITNVRFATIYSQAFSRGVDGAGFSGMCTIGGAGVPGPQCSVGSFYTVGRLWESDNDPTSKDTIVFQNINAPQAIQKGNGTSRTFTFDIGFTQSVAQLVEGSIKVYAGTQLLTDSAGLFIGGGSGTVVYTGTNKGHIEVSFLNPPAATETIWVEFGTKFSAGDNLSLISNTAFLPVYYTLPMNVNSGDVLNVTDPIQSIYAAGMIGGVSISRNSLRLDANMDWIDITSGISGTVSCIEFSTDGNHMFVGTGHFGGSNVYRVSGINNVYSAADVSSLTIVNLGSLGGSVTGIAVDPNNPDNVVATSGNYGQTDFVWRSTNATTATGNAFTSIQGDLPLLPCYDAVIMVNKPGYCVVGTDMGIYATADVYANPVVWTDESASLAHTPVFALRQQTLSDEKSAYRGIIYVGTHGRAMWESTTGTGIGEFSANDFAGNNEELISNLSVYPNPMTTNGFVTFDLANDVTTTISVYDMTGKLVQSIAKTRYQKGANTVSFTVNQLRQGTYFVTLESNDSRKVAKFIVM